MTVNNLQMSEKKWFVVYSKPRSEKKLDITLIQKGIESWCPVQRIERQWSDRKKIIEEPLFKSYVFVRISEAERQEVLQTPGAIQFVHYLKKPAIISDKEIQMIKDFLLIEDAKVKVVNIEKFEVDAKVKIRKGVFMDKEGTVIRLGKKTAYVAFESLGAVMYVEFNKEHLLRM